MICLRFTVLSIRASRLRVIEGWYDRERLRVWAVCRSALLCSHSVTFFVAHDRNVCCSAVEGEFCPVGRVASEIKVLPVVWYWILREGELER